MVVGKILFGGTYPDQGTGYGRVASKMSEFLMDACIELVYFGTGNHALSRLPGVTIDPRIQMIDVIQEEVNVGYPNEHFGVHVLVDTLLSQGPDIVFFYNDVIVVCRWLNEIIQAFPIRAHRPFKIIVYLDLVYPFEKKEYIQHVLRHVDQVIFFSKYWMDHVATHWLYRIDDTDHRDPRFSVLHHGVEPSMTVRMDKHEARAQLSLPREGFFFLNMNRNSYRKALDLTVRAFLLLLVSKQFDPDLKLVFKCMMDNANRGGYVMLSMIETECALLGLTKAEAERVATQHIFSIPSHMLNDERINALYNACDVGVNTCLGEGFGLTSVEHACLGKPQIVSGVGTLGEIFRTAPVPPIKACTHLQVVTTLDDHRGVLGIPDAHAIAARMRDVYTRYDHYVQECEKFGAQLRETFNWHTIHSELMEQILQGNKCAEKK